MNAMNKIKILAVGLSVVLLAPMAFAATVVLYDNNFETPNHEILNGSCGIPLGGTTEFALEQGLGLGGVNYFYGSVGAPAGSPQALYPSTFEQTNTVEVVLVKNPDYVKQDPNIAGDYALGMLSTVQDDKLWLTFDSQGKRYINIAMDISSIDLDGCGGPFGIADPKFDISLLEGSSTGAVLDSETITGEMATDGKTFNWTHHVITLDALNQSEGNTTVTVLWDLIQSGYAAFDNIRITASDVEGDLGYNLPPVCTNAIASVDYLWPPNHKLKSIGVTGVTDPDSENITITYLGVTQDEPVNGLGDGDTEPDAVLLGGALSVRAERAGSGNGRVYNIEYQADDGEGGTCTGFVSVCVPHDQSPNKAQCVDDGQTYNSFGL